MKNVKNAEKKPYWDFKASTREGEGELYIYGDITSWEWDESDTSANSFKRDLDALGDIHTLHLYINSPGGSVFEGVTIYNILKRHKARVIVHVDGLAASIASVIAMAGDEVHMPRNAMMMIHNPWTITWGNAAQLRKEADDLDRIGVSMRQTYLDKSGGKLTEDKLIELLDAETWLSAQECFDYGFCDVVGDANQAAAFVSEELFARYRNVPEALKQSPPSEPARQPNDVAADEYRQRIRETAALELQNINSFLGGMYQ